ncbi:hypothetical protein ACHHYP_09923 [Achlya hypogyna]|uniref:Cilia- and flagella-associated protein 418 n=1 Tax=Achlya hypogyna TaxID=1202772 RepID=A0A1V9YM91_ACHHY|nr:hypothetical protein ACHHYP_09923 [Achlya hypogyna]
MNFDDLMNEVESAVRGTTIAPVKPLPPSEPTYKAAATPTHDKAPPKRSSLGKKTDLDDLLDLVGEPETSFVSLTTPSPKEFNSGGSKKCATVALAGTATKHGQHVSAMNAAACSNLRCNDCDFTVVQFHDKQWAAAADYMFFRENVPNESKLRARMESAPGSVAYACQCKWASVSAKTTPEKERVKWCCAGH